MEERNTFITSIKSEIYRKEYKNDTQRVDLHQQLFQKDSLIKKLEVHTFVHSMIGFILRQATP